MKTINKFINEQKLINNKVSSIYFSSNDKHIEYKIVYPGGLIECFTKNGLKDHIEELNKEFKETLKKAPNTPGLGEIEDMIETYEELLDLPSDKMWHKLSGPGSNKGELNSTIGYHE